MKRYLALIRVYARIHSHYRVDLLFRCLQPMIQIFLIVELWNAVYSHPASGMPLRDDLLTYLVLINLQAFLFRPIIMWEIPHRVQTGAVTADLLVPVAFPLHMGAYQLGYTLGQIPIVVLASPVIALTGGLNAPDSMQAALLYCISLCLGYVISTILAMLLGYVAFWTMSIEGATWTYWLITAFLSGAYIPVDIMPDALRAIFLLLPFQATGYTPVALYTGIISVDDAGPALAVQVAWLAVLLGAAGWMWRRASLRLVIQGG